MRMRRAREREGKREKMREERRGNGRRPPSTPL